MLLQRDLCLLHVNRAGQEQHKAPALLQLQMQNGFGYGLEMGFRDCSQARMQEEAFFLPCRRVKILP